MPGDLVIYGTGGTSRDLLETVEAINADSRRWNILGFVDDNPALTGMSVCGYPVLGEGSIIADDDRFHSVQVAVGVGSDKTQTVRRQIRTRLGLGDSRFPAIVHPAAIVSTRAKIAAGAFLASGVFCSGMTDIGPHVIILQNTVIGHDTTVAGFATLAAGIFGGGGVRIDEAAYIGLGANLFPGITIGREARVGMGAVVLRDVAPGITVSGNPARPHGKPNSDRMPLSIPGTGQDPEG